MLASSTLEHWSSTSNLKGLNDILEEEVNISIYERSTSDLREGIRYLMDQSMDYQHTGTQSEVELSLKSALKDPVYAPLLSDIVQLLNTFKNITLCTRFKLKLATIESDMCTRFHNDHNDLRLLCTYKGPGTLWLKESNVNRNALNSGKENEAIVIDQKMIEQVPTGAVAILKGARYAQDGCPGIVHKSPDISHSKEQRLFLRIDTN